MNLLLINADQLRHDCVGYAGIRPVRTPHLDALARESVVYRRAFAPLPVCAPARQAILCGRHPDSFGAQWNYDFMPTPTVQPAWCWPRKLKDRGYLTGYLGRFHVSPTLKPADFGYDEYVSWEGQKRLVAQKYPNAEYTGGWLGCTSPVDYADARPHWLADRACEMIRRFAATGRPWHVWVDNEDPHLPCRPSEPFASMYDPKDIPPWDGFGDPFVNKPYCHRQQTLSWGTQDMTWDDFAPMVARYYGLISQLDDAIGRILDTVRACGAWDDTIIVFTSDHGDLCGSHQMLDKHYVLYDDVCRVPLIVRAPGVSARVCDRFVSNALDLPYSIIRWLNLPAPEVEHGRPLPLTESDDASARETITSTGNGQQFGLYSTRMIRDDEYKYVWNLTDVDELYCLADDPGEKVNLIGRLDQAQRVASMRRLLYEELRSHGDPFVGSEWIRRQLLDGQKYCPF